MTAALKNKRSLKFKRRAMSGKLLGLKKIALSLTIRALLIWLIWRRRLILGQFPALADDSLMTLCGERGAATLTKPCGCTEWK